MGTTKSFWAEAVKIAYYVLNRSPSTMIDLKTLTVIVLMDEKSKENDSFEVELEHNEHEPIENNGGVH